MVKSLEAALWAFFFFYVSCIAITWAVYTRRGGLLYVEQKAVVPLAGAAATPAE